MKKFILISVGSWGCNPDSANCNLDLTNCNLMLISSTHINKLFYLEKIFYFDNIYFHFCRCQQNLHLSSHLYGTKFLKNPKCRHFAWPFLSNYQISLTNSWFERGLKNLNNFFLILFFFLFNLIFNINALIITNARLYVFFSNKTIMTLQNYLRFRKTKIVNLVLK